MTMKLQDKAQFYQKLHTGIKAGMTVHQILVARMLPPCCASFSVMLGNKLEAGYTAADAMSASGMVSQWEAELIRVGESCGRLETVIENLSDLFTNRAMLLGKLRSKLVYPLLLVSASLVIMPIPAIASGELSAAAYLARVFIGLLVIYIGYRLLLVAPFEKTGAGAVSPFLLRLKNLVGNKSLLQQYVEVSYLDLFTLCLESGMDAVQTLKLMQQCSPNAAFRKKHNFAISKVNKGGGSISEVLGQNGIVENPEIMYFLTSCEQSGTLHSDLRTYIQRKKEEVGAALNWWVSRVSAFLYFCAIVYVVINILGGFST